jgi:hypothetical protein
VSHLNQPVLISDGGHENANGVGVGGGRWVAVRNLHSFSTLDDSWCELHWSLKKNTSECGISVFTLFLRVALLLFLIPSSLCPSYPLSFPLFIQLLVVRRKRLRVGALGEVQTLSISLSSRTTTTTMTRSHQPKKDFPRFAQTTLSAFGFPLMLLLLLLLRHLCRYLGWRSK